MTVCQIQRTNAEQRIAALLSGNTTAVPIPQDTGGEAVDTVAPPDLEQYALDQIRTFIGQKFKGHALARLVGAVLRAQGYTASLSPPGADGGVDIMAGQGAMGFDHPRLCVQVKSGDQPIDVTVLRELQGVMRNFRAEQGLLVAWGGFKSTVLRDARQLFFEIRLWDSANLVGVLLEHYDRLPEDLQAELPLKRIWTLVPAE